ncbi:MAG: histidine--tRNA ligase [Clostridia bacterium]|nr:histidine--tRNA ligase [Clostridia bacterium]
MKIQEPKGTRDVLPERVHQWHYVEDLARRLTALAGYEEIRTPVFEHTELFARGVGDGTDVVQKEMYTFKDRGGRSLTLKPEGTAGVVRAVISGGLAGGPLPIKTYYFTPVFRYERPQSGRLREHHQFGVEVFGSAEPTLDAEVIFLGSSLLRQAGLREITLRINSIGCPNCRPKYEEALKAYFHDHEEGLCTTCRGRLETNPLRILDCKVPDCRPVIEKAPVVTDYLCSECDEHFARVQDCLRSLGVDFTVDPHIVRGLDYYTRTVFEFVSARLGAQSTVLGGGRYNGLVSQLGGPDLPGIGFGMGIERLLLVLEAEGFEIPVPPYLRAYTVVHGGFAERLAALKLVEDLRAQGIACDMDHSGRSVKAQFKHAGRLRVPFVLVIGEDERERGTVVVRNMDNGEEVVARRDRVAFLIRQE